MVQDEEIKRLLAEMRRNQQQTGCKLHAETLVRLMIEVHFFWSIRVKGRGRGFTEAVNQSAFLYSFVISFCQIISNQEKWPFFLIKINAGKPFLSGNNLDFVWLIGSASWKDDPSLFTLIMSWILRSKLHPGGLAVGDGR